MYCKFCGKQIDDNSQFCPKCGKQLSEQTNETVPQTQTVRTTVTNTDSRESIFKSKVIHRENSRGSTVAGFVTGIIFLLIAFAVELSLVIFSDEVFRRMNSSDRKTITAVLIITLIGEGLIIIINLLKLNPVKKCYICITETGVYGSGCSNLLFSSLKFQIPYSQITNINTMSNGIILETGVNIYKVIIGNETTVANLIREKMGLKVDKEERVLHVENISNWTCPKCGIINRGVNKCSICGTAVSSSKLFADADSYNVWICPKCGKKNHNYIGTCGCGTRKP
jgi:predicted RNA-binding Zn-ribbon protein involved in translation (DUF1610 family)